MGIRISSNFNVLTRYPIDERMVVSTYSALSDLLYYEGLQTYVEDEKCFYTYIDGKWNKGAITKESLGLGNVDNTSDLDKPISTAVQNEFNNYYNKTELDNKLKEEFENINLSNYYNKSETDNLLLSKEDKSNLKALAYKDSLTKADIGLDKVNNVAITEGQVAQIGANQSDIASLKTRVSTNETNISTAQTTANEAKSIAEGRAKAVSFETYALMVIALKSANANEYKVGDNLFIKETDVPDYWISKVNTDNSGAFGYYEISVLETQKVDLSDYYTKDEVYNKTEVDNKFSNLSLDNYYTKSETDGLLDDKEDKANLKALAYKDSLTKSDVGLGNVDNTSDMNKPISIAAQAVFELKANKADVYTKKETDALIEPKEDKANLKALAYKDSLTKADIGLENVDNTSDLDKPISTLTQAALDAKANIADVYNKTEVDNLLNTKANVNDVYTKTEVDNKFDNLVLDDYYNKTEIDNKFDNLELSNYYNKVETDNLLLKKANVSDVYNKTETYNKTEIDDVLGDIEYVLDVLNGELS